MNPSDISKIRKLLDSHHPVVIITHSNPDGDAIGSSIALGLYLKKLEIPVQIIVPDSMPVFLEWLSGRDLITIFKDEKERASEILTDAKLMFCLDFNDPDRANGIMEIVNQSDAVKVLIDHHQDPVHFADITISEPWRGSVGEMIYLFLHEVYDGSYMDTDIATALYVAIMTDTGNFKYGSSYPEIFQIVGELMRFSVDKETVFRLVYDNFSTDRMRLMGYCMQHKMVVLDTYRTAYIHITSAELRKFNYRKGDTEGFVNIPFSIEGIRFTALFMEKKDMIKVSFRSRGEFAVNDFAEKHFNGGGHINAAGGEMKDTMENCIAYFEKLLPGYEKKLHKE